MRCAAKGRLLRCAALALDVMAPLAATVTQFPIWVERSSEATVSGLFLLFAFLSLLPFANQIRDSMRSPSVPVLWTVIFLCLLALRSIIDEMVVICFVGMLANIPGSLLYRLGVHMENRAEGESG